MNATVELSNVSYSTKTNAKRALKKICTKCVQHSKEIIVEVDGRFHFDEALVEKYMSRDEWNEVWGSGDQGLPVEEEPKEEEVKEVIVLTKPEPSSVSAASVLLGVTNVMNTVVCPKCGSEELYTGRNDRGFVVDDDKIIGCHVCDWEVDLRKTKKPSVSTDTTREAQKTSMKLDRRIAVRYEENGEQKFEQFKNACAMWKANPSWMTSAQEDRLTKVLYAAAKKGEYATMEINGRTFCLVQI